MHATASALPSPLRAGLARGAPWVVGALGLFAAHAPVFLSGFQRIHGDPGDARFVNYLLEHSLRWLLRAPGHTDFWSPPFFFPAPNVAAYSETMLGLAPLYWVWRAATFAPDTAFQLWTLTLSALNFAAAYLFLKRVLSCGRFPASVGAWVIAFGAPRVNQLNHPQLWGVFPSLGALWALEVLLRPEPGQLCARRARIGIAAFAACGVLQLYAGFYVGWFLGLGLVIALAWALGSRDFRARLGALLRAHPASIGLSLVGVGLALLPMLEHYLQAAETLGLRSFGEAKGMLPRVISWLDMGPDSLLYGRLWSPRLFRRLPMEHEHRIGVGLLTLALAVMGLAVGWRRRSVRVSVGVLGVLFFATLYIPDEFSLWRYVHAAVPGAQAIRAVSRVGIFLLIPLGLGVAAFFQWLKPGARGWSLPLGLVCALEQVCTPPTYDKEALRAEVEAVRAAIPPGCAAFFFSPLRGRAPAWQYQIDAMWAGLLSGVPTINGYSGGAPAGWSLGDLHLRGGISAPRLRAALDAWARRHV